MDNHIIQENLPKDKNKKMFSNNMNKHEHDSWMQCNNLLDATLEFDGIIWM
jgi:hypothetical protein